MPIADALSCRSFAFGLELHSTQPIPGVPAQPRPVDVRGTLRVHLGQLPGWYPAAAPTARPVFLSDPGTDDPLAVAEVGEGWYRFRYADTTTFVIRPDGEEVWATWPDRFTPEDMATYLLGPVMSFILRLRGVPSLHAGVVELAGGAVALVGAPGAGKSTTTAAFALAGARVLSDDLAPLLEVDGAYRVLPAYPQVRLWEDSVRELLGAPDSLPLLTPNWEKRYLPIEPHQFVTETLPLHAIFLLDTREDSVRAPRLETPSGRESFIAVLGNLHTARVIPEAFQQATFALARGLVERVPIRRVIPHSDPARLPEMLAVITNEVQRLADSAARPVAAAS